MLAALAQESLIDLPWFVIYMVVLMTTAILLLLALVILLAHKLEKLLAKLDDISQNAGQFVKLGMNFFKDKKM